MTVWYFLLYPFGLTGIGVARRQASEQYLTSAQFFAQLLRQTMSRPHATQIFRGSEALLPLKPLKPFAATASAQGVVVVVRVGAVVTAAQLHRDVLVGVGDPFNAQKGCAVRYF